MTDPQSSSLTAVSLPIVGWRERVALPDLGITSVKVKIDTGARSSALHAFDIEYFKKDNIDYVRFKVHPSQRDKDKIIPAEARLLDIRPVRNSGGRSESRPVIETTVTLNQQSWPIELTLTNRDVMGFRMLLGRQALRQKFLVDSGRSYVQSKAHTQTFKGRKKGQKKPKNENRNFVKRLFSLFDPPS
ncbi:RimK/LysX family protein [cf. Phormidesmis sp. LEGE 11477]|uniref:ATP-dependent zinc protease family protein n=1 Tax=cf. Phormidesmis sp. LEGE 11477 TaxID=1828680 RepID=UPI00187F8B86|nr:RimK/LysX family protein [cf. Phormidesmis sp. LEGE 11477]MBE9062598.1 ATP-dependent zinc protease [cf. Phormidesmis sp. LEGE 11477]